MTLDEAIEHSLEMGCVQDSACAAEHRQLAEWLYELKRLREEKSDNGATSACSLKEENTKLRNSLNNILENATDFSIGDVIFRNTTNRITFVALYNAICKARATMQKNGEEDGKTNADDKVRARILVEKDGRQWYGRSDDLNVSEYSHTAVLESIDGCPVRVYLFDTPPLEKWPTYASQIPTIRNSGYDELKRIATEGKCARLEEEKAELKRKVKLALEFTGWVGMNAENELWQTIRDKACETEFKMNHPEIDDAEGGVK